MTEFEWISLTILLYVLPAVGCLVYCSDKDSEEELYRTRKAIISDTVVSLLPILNVIIYVLIVTNSINNMKKKGDSNGDLGKKTN